MDHVIDADTHIIESQGMWDLIDEEYYARRPVLMSVPDDTLYQNRNAFWLIDGNIFPKPAGKGGFNLATPSASIVQQLNRDMPIPSKEITDPALRVAEMDRLEITRQVIYPTLFLVYLTDDAGLETALCRAYNRFMANVWASYPDRLNWVVVPPLRSIEASIEEIAEAKQHGAVGVFFRGLEGERTIDDPYFFPIYEEAARQDLPICIHTGSGCPSFTALFHLERNFTFAHGRLLPLIAFRDIIANHLPEQFPNLRFGFIEASAGWVPYVLHTLSRVLAQRGKSLPDDLFREYRLFVACEADEDIPYLTQYTGADNIMIGSDYGHKDPSNEPLLVETMQGRGDLDDALLRKILCDTPRTFYGL